MNGLYFTLPIVLICDSSTLTSSFFADSSAFFTSAGLAASLVSVQLAAAVLSGGTTAVLLPADLPVEPPSYWDLKDCSDPELIMAVLVSSSQSLRMCIKDSISLKLVYFSSIKSLIAYEVLSCLESFSSITCNSNSFYQVLLRFCSSPELCICASSFYDLPFNFSNSAFLLLKLLIIV